MNQQDKPGNEKSSSTSLGGFKTEKDRMYSLQGFINKINKADVNTFGNYFVDFSEMFNDQTDFQGYKFYKLNLSLL
jgi:hypothetical protein